MQKLKSYDLVENRVIAMYDKSWNIGVLGIAASKLAEVFNRPVMLFTFTEDGLLKGSARSISKINIFRLLVLREGLRRRFRRSFGSGGRVGDGRRL
ncbi:MAG: DHHA1 domain-containing protein [Clostridiales bacterium]|nr:MAG: DHHA1 domain-containing protein [Clostridiales bacterium]